MKLMDWLGVPPARQEGSVPFIRAVVAQRNYKSAEEIAEIEKACDVTADMHITAMKVLRPGMYEYEVVAEMNRIAEMNNCELSLPRLLLSTARPCITTITATGCNRETFS